MKVNLIANNFFNLPKQLVYELGVVTFEVKDISRVVLAQLTRHRTFSFSVQSMRYVEQDGFVTPLAMTQDNDAWLYNLAQKENFEDYEFLLKKKIKKQDARYILPLATTTTLIVSMPMKYAKNYFMQRLHKSAQPEHRALATLMFNKIYNVTNDCDDEVIELWKHALQDEDVIYYLQGDNV